MFFSPSSSSLHPQRLEAAAEAPASSPCLPARHGCCPAACHNKNNPGSEPTEPSAFLRLNYFF